MYKYNSKMFKPVQIVKTTRLMVPTWTLDMSFFRRKVFCRSQLRIKLLVLMRKVTATWASVFMYFPIFDNHCIRHNIF